jgi:triosephosphate isomerase
LRAGLVAIVCIGETRAEREAGKTIAVVKRQLRGSLPEGATPATVVVAYEPVWAIGTGLTPTAADVAEVHGMIRAQLRRLVGRDGGPMVRILYGGSVKPGNAAELLAVANVDGALVGGASLKAADFLGIAAAYR